MAVSESDRHDLYRGLEEQLGRRRAEIFMNLVTSVPWTEVATKRDLAELRAATKQDLAEHRAATLREIGEFRAATTQEFASVRGEVAALRAEMHRALRLQLLSFITVVAVFNAMTVAAVRLL
jgi:hypothetical protein